MGAGGHIEPWRGSVVGWNFGENNASELDRLSGKSEEAKKEKKRTKEKEKRQNANTQKKIKEESEKEKRAEVCEP